MRILFYYPSNKQSIGFNTIFREFINRGHEVLLLTTSGKGILHREAEGLGVRTFSYEITKGISFFYYFRQLMFLLRFCRREKVDAVFSHLQQVNIISVFAQYFVRIPFIIFRHHFKFNSYAKDDSLKVSRNERIFDNIINRLARVIVVPSMGVYNGMKEKERVNMDKVKLVRYIYDFTGYKVPDLRAVAEIRKQHECKLLLIMCSRLIKFKRHRMVFEVVNDLLREGLDIKMLVLDEGPEQAELQQFIRQNGVEGRITMLGYRTDFMNFMGAADLLVHPSLTEASNSSVKEFGLLGKTAMVCTGVGDFDEYFIHRRNGFLLSIGDTAADLKKYIREAYDRQEILSDMGQNLKKDVIARFSVSKENFRPYEELLNLKR